LDSQCFAVPVLVSDDNASIPSVQATQVMALCLKTGEDFKFVAPPTAVFSSLGEDIERLRNSMYECLQSIALNAAAIPQAGRLSGEAVDAMRMPMTTLINSFAWPIKDAMSRLVNFLREYRGDEFEVKLEGFEQEQPETPEEAEAAEAEKQEQVKKAAGIGEKGAPTEKEKTIIASSPAPKSGLEPGAKLAKWPAKVAS
jgi:hypothetical protein